MPRSTEYDAERLNDLEVERDSLACKLEIAKLEIASLEANLNMYKGLLEIAREQLAKSGKFGPQHPPDRATA